MATNGRRQRLLDHRMASAVNREREAAIDLRPHVALLGRERCERSRDVKGCERLGGRLDILGDRRDARSERIEDLELDPERAVGGACDLGFKPAQFGRGEAHLAGQGLAVDEGLVERRRHQAIAVLRGHLDEIAEHVVVPDLERADLGFVRVARLQRGHDPARLIAQRPGLIECLIVTGANEAAVAAKRRKLVGERVGKLTRYRRIRAAQGGSGFAEFLRERLEVTQPAGEFLGGQESLADRGEIARSAAPERQPRERAGQIRCGGEARAQFAAQRRGRPASRRSRPAGARSRPGR